MNNYENTNEFLYQIDCNLTQYIVFPEEPDHGYMICKNLIHEIETFVKRPAIVLEQHEYMTTEEIMTRTNYKLTQFIDFPMDPEDGYFLRQRLLDDIESEIKQRLDKRTSFNSVIGQLSYHPHFMGRCIQQFDDVEDFFESMGY